MKNFILNVNVFKYGKQNGNLAFSEYVLIKAADKETAKFMAKELTNSTYWAMDLTAYADLRFLKEVKSKVQLDKIAMKLDLVIDDIYTFE